MKAHELMLKLNQLVQTHGNLDIIIEVGEMSTPETVDRVEVIDVNIDRYGYFHIPFKDGTITNGKAFLLIE